MEVLPVIDQLAEKPEDFFARNAKISTDVSSILKSLHLLGKSIDEDTTGGLEILITDGFASEQIWQQLELTTECINQHLEEIFPDEDEESTSLEEDADLPPMLGPERKSNENEKNVDLETSQFLDDSENEEQSEDDEKQMEETIIKKQQQKKGNENEEKKETKADAGDGEQIPNDEEDLLIADFENYMEKMESGAFGDDDENESEEEEDEDQPAIDAMLMGIRGKIEQTDIHEMLDQSKFIEEESEKKEMAKDLSNFEQRQWEFQAKIDQLEEKNLNGRGWQLMGEADAKTRPKDSLVEQAIQFDRQDKFAPVVDEDKDDELEALIKQRVIDQLFDDVVRKDIPKEKKKRKLVEVEGEKSKYGLAEIYEREFLDKAKESMGLETSEQEKLSKQEEDILKLKIELFFQLDSLTNFHFTPRPPDLLQSEIGKEIQVIEMEEAIPMAQADPELMQEAPEEIKTPINKLPKGELERSRKERKAEYRTKKRKKRKREAQKTEEQKLMATHNKKLAKTLDTQKILGKLTQKEFRKAEVSDKTNYGSSKTVFTLLQERKDAKEKGPPKKKQKLSTNSSKYML